MPVSLFKLFNVHSTDVFKVCQQAIAGFLRYLGALHHYLETLYWALLYTICLRCWPLGRNSGTTNATHSIVVPSSIHSAR